jgi:hypothetical protein
VTRDGRIDRNSTVVKVDAYDDHEFFNRYLSRSAQKKSSVCLLSKHPPAEELRLGTPSQSGAVHGLGHGAYNCLFIAAHEG